MCLRGTTLAEFIKHGCTSCRRTCCLLIDERVMSEPTMAEPDLVEFEEVRPAARIQGRTTKRRILLQHRRAFKQKGCNRTNESLDRNPPMPLHCTSLSSQSLVPYKGRRRDPPVQFNSTSENSRSKSISARYKARPSHLQSVAARARPLNPPSVHYPILCILSCK